VERRRRFWASVTIVILGVGSMVGYAVLSLVASAQPSTSPNPGWVAVLQPGASSEVGEILLRAEAAEPGAPGGHPSLVYSVLACGDQPFRGLILLGGQARLDTIVVSNEHMVTSTDQAPTAAHVTAVPDLALGFGGEVWHLGPVQEIPIVVDQPTPCLGATGADQQFMDGTGTTVSGLAQGPIQRTGSFWRINGPHTSQVWPLIGGFPTALPGALGLFTGVDGLQGTWSIPAVLREPLSMPRSHHWPTPVRSFGIAPRRFAQRCASPISTIWTGGRTG